MGLSQKESTLHLNYKWVSRWVNASASHKYMATQLVAGNL